MGVQACRLPALKPLKPLKRLKPLKPLKLLNALIDVGRLLQWSLSFAKKES